MHAIDDEDDEEDDDKVKEKVPPTGATKATLASLIPSLACLSGLESGSKTFGVRADISGFDCNFIWDDVDGTGSSSMFVPPHEEDVKGIKMEHTVTAKASGATAAGEEKKEDDKKRKKKKKKKELADYSDAPPPTPVRGLVDPIASLFYTSVIDEQM